jgi:hypothetical protein
MRDSTPISSSSESEGSGSNSASLRPPASRRYLRGVIILCTTVLLALGAATMARALFRQKAEDWICKEFCRTAEQSAQVRQLETSFREKCSPECARMCSARNQVREIAFRSDRITPELRAAIEETNKARGASYTALLEHVYSVAAVLPEEKRGDYLRAVLPSLTDCCSAH